MEDGLNYQRITFCGQDPLPVRKRGLWQPPKCGSGNTHCDFLTTKDWSCHMRSLSHQFPTVDKNRPSVVTTICIIHLRSKPQSSEGGLEPVFRSKKFQGCREKDTPKLETNGMSSCRTMCSWLWIVAAQFLICFSWISANPFVTFEVIDPWAFKTPENACCLGGISMIA